MEKDLNRKSWLTRTMMWSINNLGWFIIAIMALVILIGSQLGTWHLGEGNIHSLTNSYDEFGIVFNTKNVIEDADSLSITIGEYYKNLIENISIDLKNEELKLEGDITLLERSLINENINSLTQQLDNYIKERNLIAIGVIKGINLNSPYTEKYTWVNEYDLTEPSRLITLATKDTLAWIFALLLGVMSFLTKREGQKIGQKIGLKDFWTVTMLHSNLASKIAPNMSAAEEICLILNANELKAKRLEILRKVSLEYEDVFKENGTFVNNPNFVKVTINAIPKLNGKIKYKEDKYQKTLFIRQKKAVKKLLKLKIKEVHITSLMEAKNARSERYDFGDSLARKNRKNTLSHAITSLFTMMPLVTATWIFTKQDDPTMLILSISGIIFNFVMMLVYIGTNIVYIADEYIPNINKRNDVLLEIGTNLGILTNRELHWYDLPDDEKRKGITFDDVNEIESTTKGSK